MAKEPKNLQETLPGIEEAAEAAPEVTEAAPEVTEAAPEVTEAAPVVATVKVIGVTMDMRDPYSTDINPWIRVGEVRDMQDTNWLKSQIEAGYLKVVTE